MSSGPELLAQSLLPAVLDLAEDGRWRIRLAVIKRMPLLAKQLGGEFFTDRLLALCVGWLGDDISSIREEAAANLKELTALLGSEWSVKNLLTAGAQGDGTSVLPPTDERRAGRVAHGHGDGGGGRAVGGAPHAAGDALRSRTEREVQRRQGIGDGGTAV